MYKGEVQWMLKDLYDSINANKEPYEFSYSFLSAAINVTYILKFVLHFASHTRLIYLIECLPVLEGQMNHCIFSVPCVSACQAQNL